MNIEEKVGQMFLARYPGPQKALSAVKTLFLGGFTLYEYDFEHEKPASVRASLAEIRENSKIPPFFAVDEEGGTVTRVSRYPQFGTEKFKAPAEILRDNGKEGLISDQRDKAALLLPLGINFNLAPVCDMAYSEENFIYKRTLQAGSAKENGELTAEIIKAANKSRLISCLKHFPGYGDNVDTHTLVANDKRPLSTFEESDLIPFQKGIDAGAPVVMISHNIVECFNPELPASIAPEAVNYLRGKMRFEGVIMTDSLDMKGLANITGEAGAAVPAILAGNDLLCTTSYEKQIPKVIQAVKDGIISEKRLDESVERIINLKKKFGIIKC